MRHLPLKPWGPLVAAATAALTACTQAPPAPAAPAGAAVATVNGVVLTEDELALALKKGAHGDGPPSRAAALDRMVRDELLRQRALELGLAAEPGAAAELRGLELALQAARRRALAEALLRHEAEAQSGSLESEARAWFDSHQAELATEVKVLQLFVRDAAVAQRALAEVQGGASFADVTRREGRVPELDFLDWRQMPPAWREVVYALEPGHLSPVIRGPNGRFWVLQLVERRKRPALSYEQVAPQLIAELRSRRAAAISDELVERLKAKGQVVYPP